MADNLVDIQDILEHPSAEGLTKDIKLLAGAIESELFPLADIFNLPPMNPYAAIVSRISLVFDIAQKFPAVGKALTDRAMGVLHQTVPVSRETADQLSDRLGDDPSTRRMRARAMAEKQMDDDRIAAFRYAAMNPSAPPANEAQQGRPVPGTFR